MTIASFLSKRRRVLAICAASVLLHYLAIGWVGARIGGVVAPPVPAPVPPSAPALQAPPLPGPATPAASANKPRRVARPAPMPAEGDVAAASAPAAPAPVEANAADAAPGVESPQLPAPPDPVAVEPKAAEVEAPVAPRYKVSLPPSAQLTMDVVRTDAGGAEWSGMMDMAWRHGNGAYTMKVEASISMLVARVNLLTLTSEGAIDDSGSIAPRTATEKRRGKAQTATHFNAQDQRITFSASERSVALLAGTQDKATVPLQLAGIARADSAQLAAGVDMLVGEERDANVFSFIVVGQEEIDTGMGRMATWRLARPPRVGAYNSRLDVWLAPAHNWYPVRIRNTEANGAVTTQTIRKIVITDAGQ